MRCKRCGYDNLDNSKYCLNCGTLLSNPKTFTYYMLSKHTIYKSVLLNVLFIIFFILFNNDLSIPVVLLSLSGIVIVYSIMSIIINNIFKFNKKIYGYENYIGACFVDYNIFLFIIMIIYNIFSNASYHQLAYIYAFILSIPYLLVMFFINIIIDYLMSKKS